MAKFMNFIKSNYLMIFIFTLLILLRFIWIDRFPPGMQYDEIEYSLSSKTFQMMGTDLSGVGFPESLITTRTLGKISPVPYMILSPFWNILDLNITTYRSLYVFLNIITAFVFMMLLHQLFKEKFIIYSGGLLFLLNPWSFFLSRHGMDGSFALIFYLLGTIFLLKNYSKKNIIISFLFLILGIFSYHGAKLPVIPLVTIVSLYKIFTEKKRGKQLVPYIILVTLVTATVAAFVFGGIFLSQSILDTRSHEFVFTNTDQFSGEVNSIRTASINSPIHNLTINKVIFAMQYFIGNYLHSFDPILLFLYAEVLEFHGFFYIFEAALLVTGFVMLFYKKQNIFWLITGLAAIAPISTATSMSGFSIINRAIFLLPMLIIYISYGLYILYETAKKFISAKILLSIIVLAYLGAFIFFQYTYFFILPIQINMHYQTNTRILAKYLSFEKKLSPKIIIVADKPQVLFSGLVFYLTREEQEKILKQKQTFKKNLEFTIDNILIRYECVSQFNPEYTYIVDHNRDICTKKIPAGDYILNQKDAATDLFIIGGKACQEYKLNRWRYPHLLSDFNVESMDTEQFCKRWIASPDQ